MGAISKREKPELRSARRSVWWAPSKLRLFLAYAEYLGETDDPDYVLMAMVDSITDEDDEFRAWLAVHPKAGAEEAKPKRAAKSKKTAERAAA